MKMNRQRTREKNLEDFILLSELQTHKVSYDFKEVKQLQEIDFFSFSPSFSFLSSIYFPVNLCQSLSISLSDSVSLSLSL